MLQELFKLRFIPIATHRNRTTQGTARQSRKAHF